MLSADVTPLEYRQTDSVSVLFYPGRGASGSQGYRGAAGSRRYSQGGIQRRTKSGPQFWVISRKLSL